MALESAVANAENNHQLDVDRLVVTEAIGGTKHGFEAHSTARPWPDRADRSTI